MAVEDRLYECTLNNRNLRPSLTVRHSWCSEVALILGDVSKRWAGVTWAEERRSGKTRDLTASYAEFSASSMPAGMV
jgi:hypothetical protein